MKIEVKILLFPEEHKSKNGAFFEDLMRSVFKTQGYDIQQNINFTGLEIDLIATHSDRNETLYIECKAKEKAKSTEIKNFAFNVIDKEADYGYFVFTEELDHQAAGLKIEMEQKEKYKNLTFFGPDKIVKSLEKTGRIKHLDTAEIEKNEAISKIILAYTYFGTFYIVIPFSGSQKKKYYLFDTQGKQIEDAEIIADKAHSGNITIDKALKNSISELIKLQHEVNFPSIEENMLQEKIKPKIIEKQKPRFAILTANPIDIKSEISLKELSKCFSNLDILIDSYYLSIENLRDLEGYDYIVIASEVFKGKIYIEDEYLRYKLITINELEDNLMGDSKALILLTNEKIGIDTGSSIINIIYSKSRSIKECLTQFIFQAFKKNNINSLTNDYIITYNLKINSLMKLEKKEVKVNHIVTKLPNELELDKKKYLDFVGRKNDQQNLIRIIMDLASNQKVLNIKGSGGIGKTTIASKIIFELSERNRFREGISFVACEHIFSYKAFESKIAQCFKLDNITNLKEHLSNNFDRLDALVFLDNFETLLTLESLSEILLIKALVENISNYATIIVTSRDVIGYNFEEVYPLGNLTSDEAYDLFNKNYNVKFKTREDEKILRIDIIETLLNNNPLAIKLITANLPTNKEINELKRELENDFDFFTKTSNDLNDIFDREADFNIERRLSLFHSINYSYRKLPERAKIVFELLYLFPDGISLNNFKECFNNRKDSENFINDRDIKILEDKSLIENQKGVIRLQSIIGRFAKFKFENRSEIDKIRFYKDAFSFNLFLFEFLLALTHDSKHSDGSQTSFALFDNYSKNLISVINYIDKVEEKPKNLINYIGYLSRYILSESDLQYYLQLYDNKIDFFDDYEGASMFFKILKIELIYFHRIFEEPYNRLQEVMPLNKLIDLELKNPDDFIQAYCMKAFVLYSYEGFTLNYLEWLIKNEIYGYTSIESVPFYLGSYSFISVKNDFYKFEKDLNLGKLKILELKKYIKTRFEKNHLSKLQSTYTLSKIEFVSYSTIQKLVVTNPYSHGLKNLMFAFIEENNEKKRKLFLESIENLEHIKYYYIEAIFFYAKYLKENGDNDFFIWFNKGLELSDKFYYRFLKHNFICLDKNLDLPYNEDDYPLPYNIDINMYIEKYNDTWGTKEINKKKTFTLPTTKRNESINMPKLIFVEGKTDKKILEKAIELYSDKLIDVEIKTITSNEGAGTDWIRKSMISFAANPDKNKGKAIAILDYDTAGITVHSFLIGNDDFKKEANKGNVKSILLGKDDKPQHILEFYQKQIFHKETNFGICLESFFSFKYWNAAKTKGYLNKVESLLNYKIQNPHDQLPKDFLLDKGIKEENLIYIFYEFDSFKKENFANYLCALERNESEIAFSGFRTLILQLEKFFNC